MIVRDLWFESEGSRRFGVVSIPPNAKSGVVLAHGFLSDQSGYHVFADALAAQGLASIRFDFFGHGKSEGDFAHLLPSVLAKDVLAARSALLAECARDGVRLDKVGVFGNSIGGLATIVAAASGKGVFSCVALRGPVVDFVQAWHLLTGVDPVKWKADGGIMLYNPFRMRPLELKYAFYEDGCSLDVLGLAKKIHVPVAIFQGSADELCVLAHAQELHAAISGSKLTVYAGATHDFGKRELYEAMVRDVSSWLVSELK